MCDNSVHIFTCVRIWYQFFTRVSFETIFIICDDLVPIFHRCEVWYRFFTRVKIWYRFVTFVKCGASEKTRISSSHIENYENVKFERKFYTAKVAYLFKFFTRYAIYKCAKCEICGSTVLYINVIGMCIFNDTLYLKYRLCL